MTRTIPERESLTVEFKSDRAALSDKDLIATVVCLANTEGGEIYLGVEDNGQVTGLHSKHQNLSSLAAMIANRTNPPVSVRVTALQEEGYPIACIEVPKSHRIVATSDGLLQRRRLQVDGTPQCVPFYPYEFATRQSDLGLLDYSALPVPGSSVADFDPLERERLRQLIERYGGDRTLLSLADEELDGALGFVRSENGLRLPTVTGLLILGRESTLRQHLPTHEVAFQVLDGTQVRVNDFYRIPLLKLFERVIEQFEVRVEEDEVQIGLFRVPVPNYDRRAFREAFVNALIHRDYTKAAAIHVRWENYGIVISNPGGFVEGVTLENLLVVEPRPRNPFLADALKRIGLAERTGRGVDLIYQGLLRYGRSAPDYQGTNPHSVVVRLPGGEADLGLLRVVTEEENRRQSPLPVESLIALGQLRQERRLDTATLAQAIQRDEAIARSVLERLVEAGLVEAHGIKKGRTYTLSPQVYRELGQSADYIRQAGFEPIQQEYMVLQYVKTHGKITRKLAVELCRINEDQASRLLRKLAAANQLKLQGQGRAASYVIPEN
ncbi:RNA-binding domain-containing protein [Oscillatoria acuminata]|uniref:Putative transcriptional regulator with HTH domain n=1 Tax=Oscillatoria acuminata PCC 6304 TaxID=56110 RepID=K9TI77_9CYAN|nr:RNA-binding domain-containing protein [Oscillatoria acuminata]AFY81729.1 putative transcriptional regulator with HTH domain [Oscillatoria acuminata PCC 6304]